MTVVVRHTPQMLSADPDYDVAMVARFSASGDVPVESLREEIMRWLLDEADFTAHSEIAFRRRHINAGASGAEAEIVVGLLGGAAGGVSGILTQQALGFIRARLAGRTKHLEAMEMWLRDLEGMRFAVARAFDIRPSDLRLVEERASERLHDAVFEDLADRLYGVRIDELGLMIRRLQPDER